MARYKGTFSIASNYEPLVGGPFDARELVDTKEDLINPSTWQQPNGDLWIYEGMQVSVKNEHSIYILNNPISYFEESSWTKIATYEDLNNKIGILPEGKTVIDLINNIEVGGYDDSELVARIEAVEEDNAAINKDFEALKGLIGASSVEEQISQAIDELAEIAKTGNINDLTQSEGEYVVLACGSSDELK